MKIDLIQNNFIDYLIYMFQNLFIFNTNRYKYYKCDCNDL